MSEPPTRGPVAPNQRAWHAQSVHDVTDTLGVDVAAGLSSHEAATRRGRYGPNQLTEAARVPVWRKVLRLLADKMTLVLLVAASVSAIVSREWEPLS